MLLILFKPACVVIICLKIWLRWDYFFFRYKFLKILKKPSQGPSNYLQTLISKWDKKKKKALTCWYQCLKYFKLRSGATTLNILPPCSPPPTLSPCHSPSNYGYYFKVQVWSMSIPSVLYRVFSFFILFVGLRLDLGLQLIFSILFTSLFTITCVFRSLGLAPSIPTSIVVLLSSVTTIKIEIIEKFCHHLKTFLYTFPMITICLLPTFAEIITII